jgi:hypothetical protein
MRTVALLAFALTTLLVACSDDDGGGSPDLPEGLEDVCTQGDEADTDNIKVDSPAAGDDVSSPLVVTGEIVAFEQAFWVSVVNADGDHIIDYPERDRDLVEGELSAFDVNVPFTVGEETPACLWVYRINDPEPPEAIKVPITLLPPEAVEADPQ